MATTQLALYNAALTEHLGERRLASLAEDREPRRVLDDIWDGGAREYCLEQGSWKFALRVSQLIYSPAVTPAFGYRYAFEKPADFVKITKLCSDEHLQAPLLNYTEEAGMWFSDNPEIYLSYVSKDAAYGFDLSRWPETFVKFVAAYLAHQSCNRLKQSANAKASIAKELRRLLTDARSKDAIQGATQFMPQGGWVSSRGGSSSTLNRGSKVSLYG